jgi:hypothetical protein
VKNSYRHPLNPLNAKSQKTIKTSLRTLLIIGTKEARSLQPVRPVLSLTYTAVPLLTISRTNTNTVVVSWPSPSTGWDLQQNGDLSATS